MWHTSRGDRTLIGAEAVLVGAAIDTMVDELLIHLDDELEDDQAWQDQYGLAVYDSLTLSQQVGLLHDVASHLLTETPSVLPLSAAAEAAVAAIFMEIRDQVTIEIDLSTDADAESQRQLQRWRTLVLSAAKSGLPEVAEVSERDEMIAVEENSAFSELPRVDCPDKQLWSDLIESLAEAILWDRDFEMADCFLDVDPGISQQRRRLLGIDDDYFTRVAPDPRPEELEALVDRTRSIVRAKPR